MNFKTWEYKKRDSIQSKPGIYILYTNNTLNKIYKKDKKGILYIGHTKYLKKRLRVLKKGNKKWKNWFEKSNDIMFDHSLLTFAVDFDEEFNLIPHKMGEKNGLLDRKKPLILKYLYTKNYEECKKHEELFLRGHLMYYGQLPPFNVKGPSLKNIWNSDDWGKSQNIYKKLVGSI